jgi:hypothetical protein
VGGERGHFSEGHFSVKEEKKKKKKANHQGKTRKYDVVSN